MTTPSVSQVIRATGIPAFVKNAHVITDEGDLDYRSKEATYVSFVRTLVKSASAHDINECIDHVRFWKIEEACAQAKAKYAELMQTPEIAEDDYALQQKTASGKQVKKYAAYDAPTTADAAISFYENRKDYPYEWRSDTATKLLTKAAQHRVVLPEYVHRYLEKAAAFGAVGADEIEDALIAREQACPHEFRDEFQKVAELCEHMIQEPALRADHDFVKSAMTAIDQFDTMIQFNGGLIEEAIPDTLTVGNLQKVAAEQKYEVKLVNGHNVDVRGITKEALLAVDPALSTMSSDQLADVLPTLPRGDADLLTKIIA